MNKLKILLIGVTLLCSSLAFASSEDAWASHFKEVETACLKGSGFNKARPASGISSFDDSIGYDALIVSGRYPQPHMKNAPGKALCLFNRKTKQIAVSELSAK